MKEGKWQIFKTDNNQEEEEEEIDSANGSENLIKATN